MRTLRTEIEIGASQELVWKVLTDFPNYSKWSSFINDICGDPFFHSQITLTMTPPGQPIQKVKVKLLVVDRPHTLSWLGHIKNIPLLVDGEHTFAIVSLSENKSKLIHCENFRGLLVPILFPLYIKKHILSGFNIFNTELKTYCEKICIQSGS